MSCSEGDYTSFETQIEVSNRAKSSSRRQGARRFTGVERRFIRRFTVDQGVFHTDEAHEETILGFRFQHGRIARATRCSDVTPLAGF